MINCRINSALLCVKVYYPGVPQINTLAPLEHETFNTAFHVEIMSSEHLAAMHHKANCLSNGTSERGISELHRFDPCMLNLCETISKYVCIAFYVWILGFQSISSHCTGDVLREVLIYCGLMTTYIWSTLAEVMDCWPTVPSYYLNQCWPIINGVMWHSPKTDFTGSD